MKNELMPSLLIVEDSDEDYKTLMRIFRKLAVKEPVHRCVNAKECFDYLHAQGQYAERTEEEFPDLLLLDLNLPGTSGHGILRQVKAEPALKCLPVVILTTSTNPNDVEACYEEGASSYLVKPMDYHAFEQTIRRFVEYWFHAVHLPFSGEAMP